MKTLAVLVVVLCCASLPAAVSEPGFQETVYATGASVVTGMAWAPDGSNRLFVSQQNGMIRVVKDGALLPTPFANVTPINYVDQAGLLGICLDPNYVANHFVYVFITVSGSEQRIVRLTDTNNIGTSQTAIVSGLPASGTAYNGGAIGFGFDGKLYWAIGQNAGGPGVDNDLTLLNAKAGRANLNGSAPSDNPFYDGAGANNDFIWAGGLRNPFKFTFHPFTGDLWINVPGEIYDQIFLVGKGENAGWDNFENDQPNGFITPKIKYNTSNGTDTRNITASGAVRNNNVITFTTTSVHGFRQGERITIAGVGNSSFNGSFYVAATPSTTTFTVSQTGANATSGGGTAKTQNLGGAVTGGCFYNSTAFPASFRTNYFFCDYVSGRVMRAVINPNNQVQSVDYFSSGITKAIDVATGPDGALYYVTYGGTIYRTAYTNAPPGLIIQPTGLNMAEGGQANFTVRLATAPSSNVTVTVSHSSGDNDITVTNTTLLLAPTNYAVPQNVKVFAAIDADSQNNQAQFSVSAPGLATENVSVNAYDVQSLLSFISMTVSPNGVAQLRLLAEIGQTYVLEGTTNFLSWLSLSTNVASTNELMFTDTKATNLPRRFYRARK